MSSIKTLALTIVAASLMFSCTSQEETQKQQGKPKPTRPAATAGQSATTDDVQAEYANIRYYYIDSINNNYKLVKEINEEAEKTLNSMQAEANKKQAELQSLASKIQEKMQNGGYLTQQSYEADMKELQQKQQQAEMYMANLQNKALQKADTQQKAVIDSVNSFLKDYNAKNNYDAIIVMNIGSYCNPDLDITEEILEGLNARYNSKSSKKADDSKKEKKK